MAGVDLSARFEQIPEQAEVASDQVRPVMSWRTCATQLNS
jgi:hypothetical protein